MNFKLDRQYQFKHLHKIVTVPQFCSSTPEIHTSIKDAFPFFYFTSLMLFPFLSAIYL